MTQPLVILLYERILPGSQLLNRFQDLGYRVLALSELAGPRQLAETARREMPLLAVVDMPTEKWDTVAAVSGLRQDAATSHIPVIAIIPANDKNWEARAVQSQASLVVHDNAIIPHLEQFLQQALEIE